MAKDYGNERVLCIHRNHFQQLVGDMQAFHYPASLLECGDVDPLEWLCIHSEYKLRNDVEDDAEWKQIIPYVVLYCMGGPSGDAAMLFTYTRGKASGEARLHELRSVGIGGHINPEDGGIGFEAGSIAGDQNPIYRAMRRELLEEVEIFAVVDNGFRFVGLINTELTQVGRVHLGLLFVGKLQNPSVAPAESSLASPAWMTVNTLRSLPMDQLEPWTQIVAHCVPRFGGEPSSCCDLIE